MKTCAELALVMLSAAALGCHDYSLRLRDFDGRDAAMLDVLRDAEADADGAGDASHDGASPSDADVDSSCTSLDAGPCDGEGGTGIVSPTCAELACGAHAECVEIDGPRCECLSGYEPRAGNCADVDECKLDACDALTSCDNTDGGYACSACPATYGGSGETGCLPLFSSLSVSPQPDPAPVDLDVTQDAHFVAFPIAVERLGVTASFLPARTATALSSALASGETWLSPSLAPGNNWIPIEIREDTRAHTYVIRAQRGRQEAYLKASNAERFDDFGCSVAISGDTIVVGAESEDGALGGINTAHSDNARSGSGAAYVFVRRGSSWVQEASLKASDPDDGDSFGARVAIDGDTIVVGAPDEDSAPRNAEPGNDDLPYSGAVYVFVRSDGVWSQQAMLKASNAGEYDRFGRALSISGDTIVVGVSDEGGLAEELPESGAAYVFARDAGSWSEQAYLKPNNAGRYDQFGAVVVVLQDTLIVTAPGEDGPDNATPESGAAYMFTRSAGVWSQTDYVKSSRPEANDFFGASAAFDGATLIVGAPGESSGEGGVASADIDEAEPGSGAVYVFARAGDHFTHDVRLKARVPREDAGFGSSLAVDGERIVVGALDSSAARSFSSNDDGDDSMPHAGAAYLFERAGARWSLLAYVKPDYPGQYDAFASSFSSPPPELSNRDRGSIAIEGDMFVIGAAGESSAAQGVDGNADNDDAQGSGAVYVFR